MTFTYSLSADIGKVRLRLGDTVEGSGVKPTGANFSDEEIEVFLDDEGSHIMRTVAACCEALSITWALIADITVGQRQENPSQISNRYADRAKTLREQYGYASGSAAGFSITPQREDGYSEYALTGSDEVAFGPEYT